MKKIYLIIAALVLTVNVFAQAPEKMSYQAVIRDTGNILLTSQSVGMQISIRQGTVTTPSLYVESQTPTTNINGLVSIEIGSGTHVFGDFSAIDWSTGPYFIITETDPTGGSTYTITGTSELISVPYALHSKTVDSIVGGVTETDPTFAASEAAKITTTDIANLSNLSGTNTGDQIISRTGTTVTLTNGGTFTDSVNTYTSGTGIDITNNVISATGGATLTIGQSYQGGIIFWLDTTGQHGLIAATADQSKVPLMYSVYKKIGATGDGLFAGSMNTAIIVASLMADNESGDFAAKACADYSVTDGGVTYGDWYLPSKYELNLLYLQKTVVGGFANNFYWSSTEYVNLNAWGQFFGYGSQANFNNLGTGYVRAVRAF